MTKKIQHTLIGGGIGLGVGFGAAKLMKKTGTCMYILLGAGLVLGAAVAYATCKCDEVTKKEEPKKPEEVTETVAKKVEEAPKRPTNPAPNERTVKA